jgi:hypothetical protein
MPGRPAGAEIPRTQSEARPQNQGFTIRMQGESGIPYIRRGFTDISHFATAYLFGKKPKPNKGSGVAADTVHLLGFQGKNSRIKRQLTTTSTRRGGTTIHRHATAQTSSGYNPDEDMNDIGGSVLWPWPKS